MQENELTQQEKEIRDKIFMNIENLMISKKITMSEMAKHLNLSKRAAAYAVNGDDIRLPNVRALIRIANALNAELHISFE